MRSVEELIEFMDWPGDVNYEEVMKQKKKYVYDENGKIREDWAINKDPDLFFSLQSDAVFLYSEAKAMFSRGKITLEELYSLQEYLLEGLWR